MRITALATDHLRVPLARPGRVSLTDPAPAGPTAVDVILVRAETDAGLTGLGFAVVVGPGAATVRALIDADVAPLVVGADRGSRRSGSRPRRPTSAASASPASPPAPT